MNQSMQSTCFTVPSPGSKSCDNSGASVNEVH